MKESIAIDGVYQVSDNVVAQDIDGKIVIVPLTEGIGDLADDLYTLNSSGQSVWAQLDGKKSVRQVIEIVAANYKVEATEISDDIVSLLEQLYGKRFIVKVS